VRRIKVDSHPGAKQKVDTPKRQINISNNHMGQYFRLINYDKKEYIDPWRLGGLAKLWEWCANNQCRIIPFLLRQSNEGGGGDIHKDYDTAGHWAGDRISLVGDYDESKDFDRAEREFTDISDEVRGDYNDFIDVKEMKLTPRT
jgi:hypothetical protein